jgi:predicted MPP superfamily phosphohydrolase
MGRHVKTENEFMNIKTLKTVNGEFTHILHFADIHIRLTKRHEEYREVLKRLYKEIEDSPETTAVFILGDVIHSKTDLTPECVQLSKELLLKCAELRPTVLIAGNHDTNLANKNRLDSLSPIVEALNHPNLHYLKDSGLYALGNICINNYSVFGKTEDYVSGKDIPSLHRNKYKYFVALFHGPVDNAMTDIGFRIVNKAVDVSMFDNHDIALLGDIHMKQDLQTYDYDSDKPVIHYPGSLIQQNHGESLVGHGYSLWDLKTKTYKYTEIPNDYGFFTVVMDTGKIISRLDNIPKKSRIQFQVYETVNTEIKTALAQIRLLSEIIETSYSKIENTPTQSKIATQNGTVILGNITDRDYQIKLITEHLKSKLGVVEPEIVKSIIDIHDATTGVIKKDDFLRNIRWIPIKFEWENMFSYGEDNVIDFTKLNDIVGLFAPNASGKSTLWSSLTFCMFDKCDRESKASNILNTQKTSFKCKLEFEIDSKRYFIERSGKADRKGAVKVNVRFWTIENGEEVDLKGEERRDTNDIIREYLGTYDDFILTALSVQSGKNNVSVIDMGHTDRKDLLAQFMGLSVFDRLHKEANEKLNSLDSVLKASKNEDYVQKINLNQDALSQAESLFQNEKVDISKYNEQKNTIQQKIVDETVKLIKFDGVIPSFEDSIYQKSLGVSGLSLATKLSAECAVNVETIQNSLPEVEKKIAELEEKDVIDSSEKYQSEITNRNSIHSQIEKKKMEVEHKREKVDREKKHQYDKNCKFCMVHSSDIILDAFKAKEGLEVDKKLVSALLEKLTVAQTNVKSLEWTVGALKLYNQLMTQRNTIQNNLTKAKQAFDKSKDLIKSHEEKIKTAESNIELYNKNKENVLFNESINKVIQGLKLELSNVETVLKTKNKTLLDLNGKDVSL